MRRLVLLLAGCAAHAPVRWEPPARSPAPCEERAPVELGRAFAAGVEVPVSELRVLFPELHLEPWVHHGVLASPQVTTCDSRVVAADLTLTLHNRRGQRLAVGLATDVLVRPAAALAVRRDDVEVEPPAGAWLAPDRHTLRRAGTTALGTYSGVESSSSSSSM